MRAQTAQKEGQLEVWSGVGKWRASCDGEGWKLVASSNRRTAPSPPADLHLEYRFHGLVADDGEKGLSGEAPQLAKPESHSSTTRRKWWMRAAGESLL